MGVVQVVGSASEYIALDQFLLEQGWKMDPEQVELLYRYGQRLLETNKEINLTSVVEEREVWRKHFLDSLLLFFALEVPPGARVVDVGSGGGLPGIVLKIYRRDLEVTLVESSRKKTDFLTRVIVDLGLEGLNCVWARAEELGRRDNFREGFDIAVSRGVAALTVLLEYCLPLLKVGGRMVAYKGLRAEEELDQARQALRLLGGQVERIWSGRLPGKGEERRLVVVRKVVPTGPAWPRRPGMPEKRPL
jgi:16S rRNA (guanine527-N7)-methyltransferase